MCLSLYLCARQMTFKTHRSAVNNVYTHEASVGKPEGGREQAEDQSETQRNEGIKNGEVADLSDLD